MRKAGIGWLAVALCLLLCGCAPWWKWLDRNETPAQADVSATVSPVTITVEGGSAEVGDTVILPVTVSADAHLVNADIFLRYDAAVLEPVLQYDAATDSERYAQAGIFAGTVRSQVLDDGTLYVLLATADEGTAEKGTLFYVAFRLLSERANGTTVTPEVSVCHVRADKTDVDAVAAGTVSVKAGTITTKSAAAATETAPATKTEEE